MLRDMLRYEGNAHSHNSLGKGKAKLTKRVGELAMAFAGSQPTPPKEEDPLRFVDTPLNPKTPNMETPPTTPPEIEIPPYEPKEEDQLKHAEIVDSLGDGNNERAMQDLAGRVADLVIIKLEEGGYILPPKNRSPDDEYQKG